MYDDTDPVKAEQPPDGWYGPGPGDDPGHLEDPWDTHGHKWAEDYKAIAKGDKRAEATQILPHNLDAEASLIGAMMLSEEARDAAGQLTADDFYRPAHGHIYHAIRTLEENGQGIDPVTVVEQLGSLADEAGGPAAVVGLVNVTPATSNAPTYAAIGRDHSRRRKQMRVAEELKTLAQEGRNTADCVGMREDPEGQSGHPHAVRLGDTLNGYLSTLEARSDGTAPTGIPTGLPTLDQHTGGFRAGQLITVCARPGHGKSDFACQVVNNTTADGVATLIVSIEMGLEELQDRWMAQVTRLKHSRLRAGEINDRDWGYITDGVADLATAPLYIHDDPGANLATIRYQARRIPNLGLVVVDYLQLMDSIGTHENRQTEVAGLSRGLKRLARALSLPVIALAQLNRGVDPRLDQSPQTADMRESGAIEQDSDIVIGLYRDELYNKKPDNPDAGIMEAIILKHRAGALETVRLNYDPTTSTITSQREATAA